MDAGAYTDGDAVIEHRRTYEWNHSVGEILTAVLDRGLSLTVVATRL